MQWINASKQLPEREGTYLTFEDKCGCIGRSQYVAVNHFWPVPDDSGKLWWVNVHEDSIVTHWAPLPEPPNSKQGEIQKPSHNIDYTAALMEELLLIFIEVGCEDITEGFLNKIATRLNAAVNKQHCA